MLMAAGLPLPRKVFANGWLLVGGEKMSKTKLTGISPHQIIDVFGSDAYRYYFLRELSYGQDGSFSWESMQQRYTSELANDFGNLASRVTSMIERYRGGLVPDGTAGLGDAEKALADGLAVAAATADDRICALDFQNGLIAIFAYIAQVNGYVSEQAPWAMAKAGDDARLDAVLYAAAESLRAIAVLLNAVMPRAAERLWVSLGAEGGLGSLAQQRLSQVALWGQLPVGAQVKKGDVLFPRIEEATA
jgi:methionyl-tRNA synthetase